MRVFPSSKKALGVLREGNYFNIYASLSTRACYPIFAVLILNWIYSYI
jgi:hypothetical protein